MSEYTITAPARFEKVKQLDCFCLPFTEIKGDDSVHVDLSQVSFIKPPAVIGILTFIETIIDNAGCKVEVSLPVSSSVLDYMVKVDFFTVLRQKGDWQVPSGLEDRHNPRIRPVIPVTRFFSNTDVENIANQMELTFSSELLGLSTLLQPCHVIFSELADNVITHADSGGGFVLAQQYNYRSGAEIEVAVGDSGVSIPATIGEVETFESDQQSILAALKDGMTRTGDPHRGYGLGHVQCASSAKVGQIGPIIRGHFQGLGLAP
ncbi:MAG: anti-sigma regulatory factor [Planctomycetes bacterium]|nr:anti-sigma regulatory factor [Planctomycetota bacterium]